jgi:hypothetical protein
MVCAAGPVQIGDMRPATPSINGANMTRSIVSQKSDLNVQLPASAGEQPCHGWDRHQRIVAAQAPSSSAKALTFVAHCSSRRG